jgi:hypothetical protein
MNKYLYSNNLRIKIIKYKIIKKMKQLCYFILALTIIYTISCSEMYIKDTSKKTELESLVKQPSSALGKELPDADSYYQGWVHYYHYDNHVTVWRPKKFFKNNNYFSQRVPMSISQNKDKYGLLMIPNKSSFFAVLKKDGIHIFSSRDDTIRSQVDSLQIKYIKPIPEDNYLKGGVHDLGSFAIGYCFEAKAIVPNKRQITWVFCLKDEKEKSKLFKTLIQLVLKNQRSFGKFETSDSVALAGKEKTLAAMLAEKNKPKDDRPEATGPPQDGFWLLLQDWSPCSHKCGGGNQYQQWQCIPPKNGGKPCKGESIKTKKCNENKCPGSEELLRIAELTKPEVKKPIVQVAPFSSRLQRYEKCIIKENDAFMTEYKDNKKSSKMPVRILMNNSTITIYKDDVHTAIYHSFSLESTAFTLMKSKFCCFNIQDSVMSTNLCGYEKYCGNTVDNKWANDWSDHFKLFKVSCRVGKMETLLSPDDEKDLAEALRKKLGQGSASANRVKEDEIKQQMLSQSSSSYKSKVITTQNLGLKAIQKEMQLENLIRNEEKQKEELELAAIAKKIQAEKDKAACLDHSIEQRDLDASIVNDRRSAENEIKSIKDEAVLQVEHKRAKMKKLIELMRAKAALRKSAMLAELNALKAKMAEKMAKSSKSGDMKYCRKGKIDKEYRHLYCDKTYVDDFVTNSDCKSDENFCYMCCESEYGNMHIDKREKCYNMCDIKEPIKPVVKTNTNDSAGPFMWK